MKKRKRTKHLNLLVFLSSLTLLMAFQNCSVYQNEGRLFLDETATENLPSSKSEENCLPYLSNATVELIFSSNDVKTKLEEYSIGDDYISSCKINTLSVSSGPNSPACALAADHKAAGQVYLANVDAGLNQEDLLPFPVAVGPIHHEIGNRVFLRYAKEEKVAGDNSTYTYSYLSYDNSENQDRGVKCVYTNISVLQFEDGLQSELTLRTL